MPVLLGSIRRGAGRALRAAGRRLSGGGGAAFPLGGPAWSVAGLLRKPAGVDVPRELAGDLSRADIEHLCALAGLKMPGSDGDPQALARAVAEINGLRDFLSHICAASRSADLAAAEPLERIAEPLRFTAADRAAGLAPAGGADAGVGRRVLRGAQRTSGAYFVVEA
ncbi:hypothetical protein H4R18_004621 [Coemansia javaensis]|uniref:Uncharacterized protein n=1 Tax=Coemansia javaensis TaxID=2761396 RepID=A0A9W8H8I3_9FUNG|nr:hypothetical protein H4R18_004621 [Coemansia javaensis]